MIYPRGPQMADYVLDEFWEAPVLTTARQFTRVQLLDALQTDHPAGSYSDAVRRRKGLKPLLKAQAARMLVRRMLKQKNLG